MMKNIALVAVIDVDREAIKYWLLRSPWMPSPFCGTQHLRIASPLRRENAEAPPP
jgi:hypothetical protein